jgi:hypothetical protein
MGANGIITSQQYDWNKVARRVYDYYLEVLGKRNVTNPADDEEKSEVLV